eukprot:scaffold102_cov340-Pavlova_lutheri.AAC.80
MHKQAKIDRNEDVQMKQNDSDGSRIVHKGTRPGSNGDSLNQWRLKDEAWWVACHRPTTPYDQAAMCRVLITLISIHSTKREDQDK